MSRARASRAPWLVVAGALLAGFVAAALAAPEFLPTPDPAMAELPPWSFPPAGTDSWGMPLHLFGLQGARIVLFPSLMAGALVAALATVAGLARCSGSTWLDGFIQVFGELVGALPRLVVVLVVAVLVPREWKSLTPVALTWAILAAPGAMDEAAATAGRLGGERFVEALRAHGFNAFRIYVYHVVWLNLRPVLVRQAAEVLMQVVFLEIALSYLAIRRNAGSFTHKDNLNSWAVLLHQGYGELVSLASPAPGEVQHVHTLVFGLFLVAWVATLAQALRLGARAR